MAKEQYIFLWFAFTLAFNHCWLISYAVYLKAIKGEQPSGIVWILPWNLLLSCQKLCWILVINLCIPPHLVLLSTPSGTIYKNHLMGSLGSSAETGRKELPVPWFHPWYWTLKNGIHWQTLCNMYWLQDIALLYLVYLPKYIKKKNWKGLKASPDQDLVTTVTNRAEEAWFVRRICPAHASLIESSE